MTVLAVVLAAVIVAAPAAVQEPPAQDPTELLDALLSGLLGFREMAGPELQAEVARVGGVPFRSEVKVDFMSRAELRGYLDELMNEDYPASRARADQRTLEAFDLIPPGGDLREVRRRLLEQNVVGFYDERPGRKRLYSVSTDRRLTPANQLVLSHEMRHALQDQYLDVHGFLPEEVGDFDDRRMAFLALLEGDATLVMELFLRERLPQPTALDQDWSGLSLPSDVMPDTAPVLRDQMIFPYFSGRDFVRALWRNGGWEAVRRAWQRPPESTEQVLHPEKYLTGETGRRMTWSFAPKRGRLVNDGILGEAFVRTLLGEDCGEAAAGWGGDAFRVWDVSGATVLAWRSEWDSPRDLAEFAEALRLRFTRTHGAGSTRGPAVVFRKAPWSVALRPGPERVDVVSADDERAFAEAVEALGAGGAERLP
jgi:hypothetical protein